MGSSNGKPKVVEDGKACPFIQERTGDLLEYSVVYTDRAVSFFSRWGRGVDGLRARLTMVWCRSTL